jgi:hypothetical protein
MAFNSVLFQTYRPRFTGYFKQIIDGIALGLILDVRPRREVKGGKL